MNTPAILYKYLPPARQSFFVHPQVRFTPLNELNDPFEGRVSFLGMTSEEYFSEYFEANGINQIKKGLSEHGLTGLLSEGLIKSLHNQLRPMFQQIAQQFNQRGQQELPSVLLKSLEKSGAGVLSLSTTQSSLLMWSHYAGNHAGFVIGLDTAHPFFNQKKHDDDLLRHLHPVSYSQVRKKTFVWTPDMSQEEFPQAMLYTKSIDWEYEQEWRMIIAGANQKTDSDVCGVVNLPREVIREIYLGMNASEESMEKAMSLVKNCDWIELFQCELHDERYDLIFKRIEVGPQAD